jgi:hypothetical protein
VQALLWKLTIKGEPFEGRIAFGAAGAAQRRDESTQNEIAAVHHYLVAAWHGWFFRRIAQELQLRRERFPNTFGNMRRKFQNRPNVIDVLLHELRLNLQSG